MHDKKFVALGFCTELIEKITDKKLTFSALRGTNAAALYGMGFSNEETKIIREKVNRKPIPREIVEKLLDETGKICCYCCDGVTNRPYQIHHINDYASSQDHSLDNLMLVCPTHHVNIHLSNESYEEQQHKKKAWINLWNIAKEYKAKGLSFPFGEFEYVDYEISGEVTEIFSFGPPKPSVCVELMSGKLLNQAVQIINKDNRLLLSGGSGSGKTTLSFAIGAKIQKTSVYRYQVGAKESLETKNEILLFLSVAIGPILLIIDDANTKLISGHTEYIFSVASVNKKIIVINTKTALSGNDNLEHRTAKFVLPITWSNIRSTVKNNLLIYEGKILSYLKENGLDTYNGEKIGYGFTDCKFSFVLDSYASGTDSVWQFIYMLSSGTELLDHRYTELNSNSRLDLLVAFLGINQIATAEQGTSIPEILDFFGTHSYLKKYLLPSIKWIESTIEDLTQWRMVKKNRDRFNLVHRMLAIKFVEIAHVRDKRSTEEIFDMFFYGAKPIRQTLILWSWLRASNVRNYTGIWRSSRTLLDWEVITNKAIDDSLVSLTIITDILHPSDHKILNHVLDNKGSRIAELINKQEDSTLYNFYKLSMAIRYNRPDIWGDLLENIDKQLFAKLIKNANVWEFQGINSLFYAIHEAGFDSWIISLTDNFNKSDLLTMANKIDRGDVQTFSELLSLWRRYVHDITVGEFEEYMELLTKLLKDCKIKEIYFPHLYGGFSEVVHFPELVNNILNTLDAKKMANEFIDLTPNYWGNLLVFSSLAEYYKHQVIEVFLEKINLDKLMDNLDKYYLNDLYNFRLVIHQLGYCNSRKVEFAERLYPLIETAVSKSLSQNHQEHEEILHAFSKLDYQWVEMFCNSSNISITKYRKFLQEEDEKEEKDIVEDLEMLDFSREKKLMPQYKIKL